MTTTTTTNTDDITTGQRAGQPNVWVTPEVARVMDMAVQQAIEAEPDIGPSGTVAYIEKALGLAMSGAYNGVHLSASDVLASLSYARAHQWTRVVDKPWPFGFTLPLDTTDLLDGFRGDDGLASLGDLLDQPYLVQGDRGKALRWWTQLDFHIAARERPEDAECGEMVRTITGAMSAQHASLFGDLFPGR